jgi:hypothetical protein
MPSINDLFVDLRSNIENLFFDLRHFPWSFYRYKGLYLSI